jgi:two-component system LytT family response regulator
MTIARIEKCMEMAIAPGSAGMLRPVESDRFVAGRTPGLRDFMFVKSEHNVIKISFADIYYIEGCKDYVKIFTGGPRPVMTILTFRSLEEILPKNQFVRIHKSFIISIDKIKSFRRGKVLIMDKHIPIGASYSEIFDQQVVAGRLVDY